MKTVRQGVVVAPLNAGEIWLYCETDYEAPHSIVATVSTTTAAGMEPASTVTGFVVVCDYCGRRNAEFGDQPVSEIRG